MKKVGKTTRPFRYDLKQSPYDYTVEMTNRFKGLDLKERVPEELWKKVYNIEQEAMIKTIPKKKKYKKAKWLPEEALQIAEKREAKGKAAPWALKSLQMVSAAMKLRHLFLGRKAMTNLDNILKSGDITLLTKVRVIKAMVFPGVMYGCES